MRNNLLFKAVIALSLTVILLASYKKNEAKPLKNEEKTIMQIISDDPNFSFLKAALLRANLANVLSATSGTITLFAPTNAAFIEGGFANEAAINTLAAGSLEYIFNNHILRTNRNSKSFINGEVILNTLNIGIQPLVVSKGASIVISSSTITSADLVAKNGIIHTVSSIVYPRPTVLGAAMSMGRSLLATAIINVSKNTTTNFAALLIRPANQKLTLFAPSNDAFITAGFTDAFLSDPANAEAILSLLNYHLLNGEVKKDQIPAGPNALIDTFDGKRKLFTMRNKTGTYINGFGFGSETTADNGRSYPLTNVLVPASKTIMELIKADVRFSRLFTVIQYVDANTTPSAGLATLLSETANSPFTVFAPVNDAFYFLDTDNNKTIETSELAAVGAKTLSDIIKRHISPDNQVFSSTLYSMKGMTMLNGKITVNVTENGIMVAPNTTIPTACQVTFSNILATNGVINGVRDVIR